MTNRRQYYRHSFAIPAQHRVRLTLGDRVVGGSMLDLSLGGLAVRLDPPAAALAPGHGTIEVCLGAGPAQRLGVELVHGRPDAPVYGFRFLPQADLASQEEFERRVWAFLLDEQRLERRRVRTA